MNGIPVLSAEGDCIARAWENSLVTLYNSGGELLTEYDAPGDPPSKDATMLLTVHDPLAEPRIHMDLPGGFEDLEEYVMEVLEGIKDHLVRDPLDADDTRWEYTYHERLFGYEAPGRKPIDQIEGMASRLADSPHTRRAQAVTWKVWDDCDCDDPACLQSIWCRITPEEGQQVLSMNVRFRSNDAYKAALMNIFALVRLQEQIAERISDLSGGPVRMGRYCHLADSYHIYGKDLKEFESRFLGAIERRSFEQRTVRYEDVRPMMEAARPRILEKVARMARHAGGT